MKIERGVMVVKNGKAWGEGESDGQSTWRGWMDMESAPIHNPRYCTKPTDVVYEGSPHTLELRDAKVVSVERITEVKIIRTFDELHTEQ